MIQNNINQFDIKGTVKLAPATNHLIQSISHKETGDLIVYTNKLFESEQSFSNSLVEFIKNHMFENDIPIRKMLIISPSINGCEKLKKLIGKYGFPNISVYHTKIITTNYIIEKRNVLFGVENFLEHSKTNCPSVTIRDAKVREVFIDYTTKLLKQSSTVIVGNTFDKDLLS